MAIGSAPEIGKEFITGGKVHYPWIIDGVQHQLMLGDSKVVYICGHPNNIYSKFEWQCHKGCCGHDQGEPVDAPVEKEDLVESLLNMGELINQSRGIANVLMLSGEMFFEAADEIEQLRSEVNGMASAQNGWGKVHRLKEAGDALVAVIRSGSDCGWDKAIDAWEEARRG